MAEKKDTENEYIDHVGIMPDYVALSKNETSKELTITKREAFTVKNNWHIIPGHFIIVQTR